LLDLIKGSFVILASSIPLEPSLSIEQKLQYDPHIFQEYKSPTLNYNPLEEYEEKVMRELIEKAFITDE
jgi:hypothetical protein